MRSRGASPKSGPLRELRVEKLGLRRVLLKFAIALQVPISRSTQILFSLVRAAMRTPKLTIAVALLALVALASTMTYTGFVVVGVLADRLDMSRVMAGLLLGVFFARFPWLSKGKLRTVGLIPKLFRRPIMVSLLALCLLSLLSHGDYFSALFVGFATAFLVTYPWLRRAIFGRMLSSFLKSSVNQNRPSSTGGTVIDVDFIEKKDMDRE